MSAETHDIKHTVRRIAEAGNVVFVSSKLTEETFDYCSLIGGTMLQKKVVANLSRWDL